jgi:hypothetical protein
LSAPKQVREDATLVTSIAGIFAPDCRENQRVSGAGGILGGDCEASGDATRKDEARVPGVDVRVEDRCRSSRGCPPVPGVDTMCPSLTWDLRRGMSRGSLRTLREGRSLPRINPAILSPGGEIDLPAGPVRGENRRRRRLN